MKESSLAATIDLLAQRKAEEFITHVHSAINHVLKDAWRAKIAGGREWLGYDIKAVMLAYANSIGSNETYKAPKPTEDLVRYCRATIVDDLLAGLPKLKELAMMQAEGSSHE